MKALIQVSDLKKNYGPRIIFNGASVSFLEKQKIGVIGRNGAGKSTLARIIIGEEEQDEGNITKSTDLSLGYLEQKDPYDSGEKILEFLIRYTGKEDWECAKMVGRLGVTVDRLQDLISSLPGGYRMRVKLAAMLLADPNFLILDEPTNYLDLNTLILLENFLGSFNGGFLIISHDREFLHRTCDHTLEVDHGDIVLYPGPVDEYLIFKREDVAQRIRTNKNIEARQNEIKRFVERFRAKASKASQVQSRIKQLEKLQKIDIPTDAPHVNIRIPSGPKKPGRSISVSGLSIGYNEKPVADDIHFDIERGTHLAVLGDNGSGKTTLLRTITGELTPISGEIRFGPSVKVSYYAQHVYESIPENQTVIDFLKTSAAPDVTPQEIQDMAGAFLFGGDESEKPVRILSGGERARLCLAGILLSRSDILLLDEPTNHLDFETVESLAHALKLFNGTVIFVSHDRTFVNLAADKILEIRNGKGNFYPGSYEDYVFKLKLEAENAGGGIENTGFEKKNQSTKDSPSTVTGKSDGQKLEGQKQDRYKLRKEAMSDANKAKTAAQKVEKKLESLESERTHILSEFEKDSSSYTIEKNQKLEELTLEIESTEESWIELQAKIEELERLAEELK